MERIPFIEAYAHTNRWEDAIIQTREAMKVTPVMNDPLCALWQRIERDCGENPLKADLDGLMDCSFLESGK